jgi:hypothetical protein
MKTPTIGPVFRGEKARDETVFAVGESGSEFGLKESFREIGNRESRRAQGVGERQQDKRRRHAAPPSKCLHKGFCGTAPLDNRAVRGKIAGTLGSCGVPIATLFAQDRSESP